MTLPAHADPGRAVRAVTPDRTLLSQQRLPYFIGISDATAGATGLSMHLVFIPPGARAEPHHHVGHETRARIPRQRAGRVRSPARGRGLG